MRSWLRRAARPSGSEGGRVGAAFWDVSAASEPAAWVEAFASHWTQASALMRASEQTLTADHIDVVFRHLDQMALLLLTEANSQPEPVIGPILDQFFTEELLNAVVDWAIGAPLALMATCQLNLLKFYETVVTQYTCAHHCLLVHKPILLPLLRLLEWCGETTATADAARKADVTAVERQYVLLLNQICTLIADDATLLDFFFDSRAADDAAETAPRFVVFTMLVGYLYADGEVGQMARDAALLLLAAVRGAPSAAHFVAERTAFCPVLATGLSGCFSQLPRRLADAFVAADDWHGVTRADVHAHPAIADLCSALLFCNAVVQVSHDFVLDQLLDYIYHGFLASVVRPAFFETGYEELVSATAYLDLCYRTITEAPLLKVFLKFLVCESEGERKVLDVLIERINSSPRLCLVTLSLFQTLLDLYCEDLMLEMVFKYLIPCTHVMVSQVKSVAQVDYYGASSEKFLSLIPRCCLAASATTKSAERSDDSPSNAMLFSTASFAEYLVEAQESVQRAIGNCACWSLPYDGVTPAPGDFRPRRSTDDGASDADGDSARRSARFNRYYGRRHASSVSRLPSAATEVSAIDLTVLGPDFLLDDGLHDEMDVDVDGAADASSPSEPTRRLRKAAADYFKLAYDEDGEVTRRQSTSEQSQEESDAERSAVAAYVLSGWSDIRHLDTFVQMLDRVRTSHDAAAHTVDENIAFIEKRHAAALVDAPPVAAASASAPSAALSEGAQVADGGVERGVVESVGQPNGGIPVHIRGSLTSPTLGKICSLPTSPFITLLLSKLECLLDNPLAVNLQLTGVIARLASFPQPLLTSALLSSTLVLQPSVRSLFQILSSVREKADAFLLNEENFDSLITKGRKYLESRQRRYLRSVDNSTECNSMFEVEGFTPSRPSQGVADLFLQSHKQPSDQNNSSEDSLSDPSTRSPYKYYRHKIRESQQTTLSALKRKNVVYGTIVLTEFLLELAAISREHAVAMRQIDVDLLL